MGVQSHLRVLAPKQILQPLIDPAFPQPDGAHHPPGQGLRGREPLPKVRDHRVREHPLQLPGDAREGEEDAAVGLNQEPGGGADGIGNDARALGPEGLAPVVLGHGHPEGLEAGPDDLQQLRIEDQGTPQGLRHRLPGHIVDRGPQPSADHEDLATGQRRPDGRHHAGEIISHHRDLDQGDGEGLQGAGDARRVRVDHISAEQLRAGCQHLGLGHNGPPMRGFGEDSTIRRGGRHGGLGR
jgi:hypothetical protein